MKLSLPKFGCIPLIVTVLVTASIPQSTAALVVADSVENGLWDGNTLSFLPGSGHYIQVAGSPNPAPVFYMEADYTSFFRSDDPNPIWALEDDELEAGGMGSFWNGAIQGDDNWAYMKGSDGNNGWIQFDLISGIHFPTASHVVKYIYDNTGAQVSLAEAMAAIPEPSTIMLGVAGGVALIGLRRRSKTHPVST